MRRRSSRHRLLEDDPTAEDATSQIKEEKDDDEALSVMEVELLGPRPQDKTGEEQSKFANSFLAASALVTLATSRT